VNGEVMLKENVKSKATEEGVKNRAHLIKLMEEGERALRDLPAAERPFKHLTQNQVAILLSDKRTCTLRAVQYWLADPSSNSYRNCKDWVPKLLEEKLKELGLVK